MVGFYCWALQQVLYPPKEMGDFLHRTFGERIDALDTGNFKEAIIRPTLTDGYVGTPVEKHGRRFTGVQAIGEVNGQQRKYSGLSLGGVARFIDPNGDRETVRDAVKSIIRGLLSKRLRVRTPYLKNLCDEDGYLSVDLESQDLLIPVQTSNRSGINQDGVLVLVTDLLLQEVVAQGAFGQSQFSSETVSHFQETMMLTSGDALRAWISESIAGNCTPESDEVAALFKSESGRHIRLIRQIKGTGIVGDDLQSRAGFQFWRFTGKSHIAGNMNFWLNLFLYRFPIEAQKHVAQINPMMPVMVVEGNDEVVKIQRDFSCMQLLSQDGVDMANQILGAFVALASEDRYKHVNAIADPKEAERCRRNLLLEMDERIMRRPSPQARAVALGGSTERIQIKCLEKAEEIKREAQAAKAAGKSSEADSLFRSARKWEEAAIKNRHKTLPPRFARQRKSDPPRPLTKRVELDSQRQLGASAQLTLNQAE